MDLSQSFAELKRRNIRRLAVAGAIASLLLILAATMLLALFEAAAGEPHGDQQQLVIANVNNARRALLRRPLYLRSIGVASSSGHPLFIASRPTICYRSLQRRRVSAMPRRWLTYKVHQASGS